MGSTVSRKSYLFTSESVSEGHPDKVCDRISDEVVDLFFREGPKAGIDPWQLRVACETLATTNQVVIAGETRGPNTITKDWISHVARLAIKDIGYEQAGFHWEKADIKVLLHPQSADIAQGVDSGGNKEEGAGDQGIMFGYACRDTPELMPAPIYYSHKILRLISEARHSGKEAVLGPDSKSQVTVRYENGKPVAVTQIVVSHQHLVESMTSAPGARAGRALRQEGAAQRLDRQGDDLAHQSRRASSTSAVPTATAASRAARSSSTPTAAPPRTAAAPSPARTPPRSTARPPTRRAIWPRTWWRRAWPTAAPSSSSYAIGVAKPLSIYVDVGDNPSKIDTAKLEDVLGELMDLTPRGIRKHLDLNKPIYARTSAYGHFGREPDKDGGFSWEKTDLADKLKSAMA